MAGWVKGAGALVCSAYSSCGSPRGPAFCARLRPLLEQRTETVLHIGIFVLLRGSCMLFLTFKVVCIQPGLLVKIIKYHTRPDPHFVMFEFV